MLGLSTNVLSIIETGNGFLTAETLEKILEKLKENDGFLPYHDKSAPEDIRSEFGMSKNEFKRAIGRLYKSKKIKISKTGIELTEE